MFLVARWLIIFSKQYHWIKKIAAIIGFTPGKLFLYQEAVSHRSKYDRVTENNERLEFLGDAILNGIIAEYLFQKYPCKGEGFLTEMRSKIVNRVFLNDIAIKMNIPHILRYSKQDITIQNSMIFGNALEAIVGAIYLDKGYTVAKKFVMQKILYPFVILEELEEIDINIKNKLYGWAFKHNKKLEFTIEQEGFDRNKKYFLVAARIDGVIVGEGKASTKKEASNLASELALQFIKM